MEVRLARIEDAEAVARIYNVAVETSTATFDLVPRALEEQRGWIAARSGALTTLVAVDEGQVIGFSSLSPYKQRAAYRTTVEDSVYVHRDHHGEGVGKSLLSHLLEVARTSGFHAVMARIESSGNASIALHTSCGFRIVGTEHEVGRKFNRWLDVTIMQRLL